MRGGGLLGISRSRPLVTGLFGARCILGMSRVLFRVLCVQLLTMRMVFMRAVFVMSFTMVMMRAFFFPVLASFGCDRLDRGRIGQSYRRERLAGVGLGALVRRMVVLTMGVFMLMRLMIMMADVGVGMRGVLRVAVVGVEVFRRAVRRLGRVRPLRRVPARRRCRRAALVDRSRHLPSRAVDQRHGSHVWLDDIHGARGI